MKKSELRKLIREEIQQLQEGKWDNYTEIPKAPDYIAKKTSAGERNIKIALKNAIRKKEVVPVKMHDKLDIVGFSNEDLDKVIKQLNLGFLNKIQDSIKKSQSKGEGGLETFRNIRYAFNKMYNKEGDAYKYMKIINHLLKNKYADLEDLLYVYNSLDRKTTDVFEDPKISNLINNLKVALIYLAKSGILRVSGEDEITVGPRFYEYMKYVDDKEKDIFNKNK